MERPKVIHNRQTGKFVMWFHLELRGQGYRAARTAVAVSDSVCGPYTYIRSFRPNAGQWPMDFPEEMKIGDGGDVPESWTPGWIEAVRDGLFVRRDFQEGQMARDMTLFVEDDGAAYHIHASEENLTLHISQLTDDYLDFTGKWVRVLPAGHNEAPTVFKRDGKYYMITSGCTGWQPNAGRSAAAASVWGPWTSLGNPFHGKNENISFNSQSTYVIKVGGRKEAYIYMGDRWKPNNPIDGRYVWLPVRFEEGRPVIEWLDEWDLSRFERDRNNRHRKNAEE
jgi:beta-xylosidase